VEDPISEVSAVGTKAPGFPEPTEALALAADDALELFVSEHYARLIRLATLVCRSVDEAEDAVQSGLERAWQKRAALRDPASLRSWLDRIVVREAIRARGRRLTTVDGIALDDRGVERLDDAAELRVAFGHLSAEQRAAVVLHLYMGYSTADTAAMLGVPIETVRSRLRLARDRLRHLLAEEG
jgi:RNA polymerase sigma-70 factor (ECF subfamily)